MKNLTTIGVMLALAPALASAAPLRFDVSTTDYNVLRFPSAVVKAVLPPHAPLKGAPYYLSNNTVLLLRFKKKTNRKHTRPIQLVAQLADGATDVLLLKMRGDLPGQTIDVPETPGEPVPPPTVTGATSGNPNAIWLPALAAVVAGAPLPDFVSNTDLPGTLMYDRLLATPIARWDDADAGVSMVAYRLTPRGAALTIDPSQFYRPGVHAALLTGSTVDDTHKPVLYLIQDAAHD